MTTFDTPDPISVRIELATGDIHLTAGPRTDTVVEVRPSDGSSAADVKAAADTKVDFSRGKLLIKGQPLRRSASVSRGGSVDVIIGLPEGSEVRGSGAWATLRGEGPLGECRFDVAEGDIRLGQAGPVRLSTSHGQIVVARAGGPARIANGSGTIRVDRIDGSASVSNDMGETRIGEITGELKLTGMNADFRVGRAHDDIEVKTSHGSVRIGEVARGLVSITAASAEIEVGIREGTSAKLDVSTASGSVRNQLEGASGPKKTDEVVEVRARTYGGDIVIRRSW
ncbi:DUF4097 family beta strand repeat-containing protein [Streptomyces yaizuensis]|uniref:DUF4097 family beta strand repeat-containing protein n=1 Tax=Streptomyces yaizuensis TaxID=2989713 RepID=A0ABQ5P983_9ACTN|nr:DUF4097 family beta strand repeat-containing protein [Streptomyces sp. YSPA8]GLF99149.1 DUF4097 family beta strand repeat-containing protein [Streptomyces sp. YSPA8]